MLSMTFLSRVASYKPLRIIGADVENTIPTQIMVSLRAIEAAHDPLSTISTETINRMPQNLNAL
jgi:hypothetical protein